MNKERGAFITLHRPKLKLQKLTIYKCFMSIWFVLLCRPISIYYFSQEGSLNSIYIWISRILAIIAIILIVIYRNRRDSIINWIVILSLSLLTATIIENGSLNYFIH